MSLIPRWHDRSPMHFGRRKGDSFGLGKFWEDVEENFNAMITHPSGLSVYSDDKTIYVEADVPGLTAKDVEVSIDAEGILWIKGEKKEVNQNKKYYRKALHSFSYAVPLWDEIDEKVEPEATVKNGVMRVVFSKKKEKQASAKKIPVK